jgi:SH3-like domain-containing protein
MTDVANIKSAPDRKGNDLFVIHGGLKVQVLDNVNKWYKIRLADGKGRLDTRRRDRNDLTKR